MNMQKRRITMKSFVTSQFGYRALIWMFNSRRLNNRINSIYERALRIIYQDHISTFQELCFNTSQKFETLATEMFKIHRGLSPNILREIFLPKITFYNLRGNNTFERRQVHSICRNT